MVQGLAGNPVSTPMANATVAIDGVSIELKVAVMELGQDMLVGTDFPNIWQLGARRCNQLSVAAVITRAQTGMMEKEAESVQARNQTPVLERSLQQRSPQGSTAVDRIGLEGGEVSDPNPQSLTRTTDSEEDN